MKYLERMKGYHANNFKKRAKEQWVFLFSFLLYFSFYLTAFHVYFIFAIKSFVLLLFIYLILNLKSIRFNVATHEVFMLLFFSYYFFTCIFAADIIMSLRLIFVSLIMIAIYFLLKDFFKNEDKRGSIQKIIILSAFCFSVLSLLLYIKGLTIVFGNLSGYEQQRVFGVFVERGMPRLIGTMIDPNFYCMSSIFFFFFLLHIPDKSIFIDLTFFFLVVSMLLTISTGGLISVLLVLIPLAAVNIFKLLKIKRFNFSRQYFKIIIFLAVLSFIIITIYYYNNELVFKIITNRINNLSNGSGRYDIWKNGIKIWQENPIFGIGINNFRYYNKVYFDIPYYMHNTHLEVLVEGGLLGFFLYSIFHISFFKCIVFLVKSSKRFTYVLTSYLSLMIMMLSLSVIVHEIIFLFYAYISFLYEQKNEVIPICQHGCRVNKIIRT